VQNGNAKVQVDRGVGQTTEQKKNQRKKKKKSDIEVSVAVIG
jgi:hypothetical protein